MYWLVKVASGYVWQGACRVGCELRQYSLPSCLRCHHLALEQVRRNEEQAEFPRFGQNTRSAKVAKVHGLKIQETKMWGGTTVQRWKLRCWNLNSLECSNCNEAAKLIEIQNTIRRCPHLAQNKRTTTYNIGCFGRRILMREVSTVHRRDSVTVTVHHVSDLFAQIV